MLAKCVDAKHWDEFNVNKLTQGTVGILQRLFTCGTMKRKGIYTGIGGRVEEESPVLLGFGCCGKGAVNDSDANQFRVLLVRVFSSVSGSDNESCEAVVVSQDVLQGFILELSQGDTENSLGIAAAMILQVINGPHRHLRFDDVGNWLDVEIFESEDNLDNTGALV